MSIKTSIEQMAEAIGFDIANSSDETQANLINGLGRGFKLFSHENFHMQLSYASNRLNKEGEKLILELAEYIKLKNAEL